MVNESLMKQYSDLTGFIKQSGLTDKFSPFAYFDKHLDCIRVQFEDCSFTEKRLNTIFTLLKENHVLSDSFVGFNIKGISYLFQKLGLPKTGPVKVAAIIDAIVKKYPHGSAKEILEKFGGKVKEQDLSVEVNCAA